MCTTNLQCLVTDWQNHKVKLCMYVKVKLTLICSNNTRERVISNCPIQVPQVLGNCTINYYGMILSMDWDLQNYICSIKKYILHRNRERTAANTKSRGIKDKLESLHTRTRA